MRILTWIAIVFGAWFFLIAAPSFVSFLIVFSRWSSDPSLHQKNADRAFAPFRDRTGPAMQLLLTLPLQELTVRAKDGVTLRADYLDLGSEKTAIFLHGFRAAPLEAFSTISLRLRDAGYNLLFVTQRAHGKSGGFFTTLGLREADDALCWVDRAVGLGAKSVLLYGASMGAASIAYASDRLPEAVRAAVLDSCFLSPSAQIRRDGKRLHLPWQPMYPLVLLCGRIFLRDSLRRQVTDPLECCRVPMLFLHGEADPTVPLAEGRRCYEACASQKEWIPVPGAVHAVSPLAGGPALEERIVRFAENNCNPIQEEMKK